MRGEGKILMRSAAEGSRTRPGASHPDRVYSVVENHGAAVGGDEISTSWRRCLSEHGIDPGGHEAPQILTAQELRVIRGPVEELIEAARTETNRLHAMVGQLGYAGLLTSSNGVVVD